ncbi:MAG: hypothetical protein M3P01_08360 [Actinomycetota bacterium]|nr:hypothetical protein [Actinomycetota bacterium]
MHAVFVNVSIDPARVEEAREHLRSQVVPRVSQAPGFVAGYWTDSNEGGGSSCLIFDSESTAQQAAEMAKNVPTPEGVTIQSVETREVVASA